MSIELEKTYRPKTGVATTKVYAVIDDGTEEGQQVEKYTVYHESEGDLFVFPQKKSGEVRVARSVSVQEIEQKKFEPKQVKPVEDVDVRG